MHTRVPSHTQTLHTPLPAAHRPPWWLEHLRIPGGNRPTTAHGRIPSSRLGGPSLFRPELQPWVVCRPPAPHSLSSTHNQVLPVGPRDPDAYTVPRSVRPSCVPPAISSPGHSLRSPMAAVRRSQLHPDCGPCGDSAGWFKAPEKTVAFCSQGAGDGGPRGGKDGAGCEGQKSWTQLWTQVSALVQLKQWANLRLREAALHMPGHFREDAATSLPPARGQAPGRQC